MESVFSVSFSALMLLVRWQEDVQLQWWMDRVFALPSTDQILSLFIIR